MTVTLLSRATGGLPYAVRLRSRMDTVPGKEPCPYAPARIAVALRARSSAASAAACALAAT